MIAVDSNILIYWHRTDSEWHEAATAALDGLSAAKTPWAIPWPCVHEFLAVVTHPRIFSPPTPGSVATKAVAAWLESQSLVLLAETDSYWPVLAKLVESSRAIGPRIHDARIAALCVHHGITELWTADRDFSSFPDLRVRNPLVAASR